MVARSHHFVPSFFLAGFTRGGHQGSIFWVLDKTNGRRFRTSPRKAAKQRDGNAVEVAGQPRDLIERALGHFESDAAHSIRHVITQRTLPQDSGCLMSFIALLVVRVPAFRSVLRDATTRISQGMLMLALDSPERWHTVTEQMRSAGYEFPEATYDQMVDFVERGEFTVDVDRNTQISEILTLHAQTVPVVEQRQWTIVYVDDDDIGEFVTSDRPVGLDWIGVDGRMPPGLGLPNTILTLPLSRNVALLGRFEGNGDPHMRRKQ
jgi:hypothetical protein